MRGRQRWHYLFLISGLIFLGAQSASGQSGSLFNQLVEASKAEMAKKGGKLSLGMEWPKRDAVPVLAAFRKAFPFIKETVYTRESKTGPIARLLILIQQGKFPDYDIMHIASEFWPQYEKAGVFVKPPFDYKKLAKSLPLDWPKLHPRVIDPKGYFIATTGLARGNAWNPEIVPKGKEPTTWEACLDPMWKGKFLYDPRPKLTALWYDPKTREGHIKWLKGIMKNGAVLNRGQTENLQKVAAGEFALVCGVNYHSSFRIIDRGAPLKFAFPDPFPLEFGTQIHVVKWSKTPATSQLLTLWIATGGQDVVEKRAYRGLPWDPKSRKYPLAKGKYVAICDANCVLKKEKYNKLHGDILKLPGVR